MIPAIALILAVVAFRLIPGIPDDLRNFSPMAAVFLCSAAFLPKRFAFAIPFSAFLVTDMVLNSRAGLPLFTAYTAVLALAFALTFALGWLLRKNPKLLRLFGATIAASLLFYLITNSVSWLTEPTYAKSLAGWWQCMTVGTPGFPPTLLFFRNTLLGDLAFTALFVSSVVLLPAHLSRQTTPHTSTAPAKPRHS
jgi:uncharacterized membrane protein